MSPKSRTRSPKKEKRPTPQARKRGDAYQDSVAQVAKSIDPSAEVEVGKWTNGPDGRRDLDVVVRPKGVPVPMVVIECKDWNRPVGIGFIDALDSKRRDIGASAAMICSNSGFTADALRKAARVAIPALAALIEGDRRIRVVVREQIYTRIVEFKHHKPTFHHQELSESQKILFADAYTKEFMHNGKSLDAWVAGRLLRIAGMAKCSRSFVLRCKFREPVKIDVRNVTLSVSQIDIDAALTTQWMTQVAEIGASQGMYDYLRKVVVFGPGPYQFHLKNVNSETWGTPVDIDDVPPRLLEPFDRRQKPEIPMSEMALTMIKNMPQSDPKDAPDLDALILSEEVGDEDSQQV